VGRGLSRKTSDRDAMPLCFRHHYEFHNAWGFFVGWTKVARREWQKAMSAIYANGENTV
jgi:hypothetical protein